MATTEMRLQCFAGRRSLIIGILLLCCLTIGAAFALRGDASNLLVAQSSWVDLSKNASSSEASRKNFLPYDGELALGYVDGAHWVKLELPHFDDDLILTAWPLWLDNVDVYFSEFDAPIARLGATNRSAGVVASVLGATIMLAPDAPQTIWVRVETSTTSFIDLRVLTSAQAMSETFYRSLWIGLHSAILAILISIALVVWTLGFGKLFLAFALQQIAYLNYVVEFQGVTQIVLSGRVSPEVFPTIHAVSTFLVVSSLLAYEAYFISQFRTHRALTALLWALVGAVLIAFALWIWGEREVALFLTPIIYIVSLPVFWLAALFTNTTVEDATHISRATLVGYASITLASVITVSGAVLGGNVAPGWSIYWFNLGHGMLISIPMLGILILALRNSWFEKIQSQIERNKAEDRAKREKQLLEEKSRFLHMLMHELNTPLSVAMLALSLPEQGENEIDLARNAARDMKSIIDRCVQDDRLHAGIIEPQWETFALSDAIRAILTTDPNQSDRLEISPHFFRTRVCSDRQLIGIILSNILENALKYSDPAAPISLALYHETRAEREGLIIKIASIPAKDNWPDPARLFKRYYRSRQSSHVSGSGLGLHLARGLASLVQGDLTYEKAGKEAVFALWIPTTPSCGSSSSRTVINSGN